MRVIVISGSRSPKGQTARAAEAFLRGARAAGASAEMVFLPQMKIERCRQCDEAGWGLCRKEGRCEIEDDDFAPLVEKLRASDGVAFATPVYFSDLSESMRAFLDRLRRITRHDEGKRGITGKRALGICVAGGGGGGAPQCAVALERVLHHCGLDAVDMVPARRQNLDHKTEVLEATGRWFASPRPEA
jgi:multimeric flavodoxin WrbA